MIEKKVRFRDDEKSIKVVKILDEVKIDGLSENQRLVEDIYIAEVLRKEFNYIPIIEILVKLLTNSPKEVKQEEVVKLDEETKTIDSNKIKNMLEEWR